jgi:uncharacterized protein
MKYLLDVSTLVALLWENHVHHRKVATWATGKTLIVCPITELGFLRVSTSPAFGATMRQARQILEDWLRKGNPEFVPADLRALKGDPAPSSSKTTDWYLANLAQEHGMKWATLDTAANHRAADLIA